MKKILLLFSSLFFCCIVQSQNLVPNPSFEDTVHCPYLQPTIDYALHWSSYYETSDYFNPCANSSQPAWGVPNNTVGYQNAFIGDAYAGLVTWCNAPNLREYMGVQLTSTLVIGTKYYVSFYASNADSVDGNSSSNNLGIRFSTISYSFSSQPPPLNNTSHIHADSIITDKINWTRVAGSIIADSAYQYLIIANFYDDAHTLVDTLPTFLNKCAYYYIDAVCVTTDSVYDANWIGISEIPNHNSEIKIFPNPFHSTFTLHCPQAIINSQLKIYNSLGEIIRQQIITSPNQQIDLEVGAGVYFLKIEGYPVFTQKLLVH